MNDKDNAMLDEIELLIDPPTEVDGGDSDEEDITAIKDDADTSKDTVSDVTDSTEVIDTGDTEKIEDDKGDGDKEEDGDDVEPDDKAVIESLRKQLEDSHSDIDSAKISDDTTKEVVVDTIDTVEVEVTPNLLDFIGDNSIDDLVDTKEGLNKMLNIVYNAAVKATEERIVGSKDEFVRSAVEESARKIPGMVTGYVTRQSTIKDMVDTFYKENSDLTGFKKTVAAAANQVHAEHSDWEIGEIFKEAAVVTRKALHLPPLKDIGRNNKDKDNDGRDPAFAGKHGSRGSRTKPDISSIEKEINAMIDL